MGYKMALEEYTHMVLLLQTGEYVIGSFNDYTEEYHNIIRLNNTNYIGPYSEPWINHPILSTDEHKKVTIHIDENIVIKNWVLIMSEKYSADYEKQAERLFGPECFRTHKGE